VSISLADYAVQERNDFGTIIGQRAHVLAPSPFLKLASVRLQPTTLDKVVSYGQQGVLYLPVARVQALPSADGLYVIGNDPTDLYSFPLLLPIEKELSVETILSEFNAQLAARFYLLSQSEKLGRWGSSISFSMDANTSRVQFKALFSQRFDSRDYDLIVYNTQLFSQCFKQRSGGINSSFRFTLGYILGFQEFLQYDLSQYVESSSASTSNSCLVRATMSASSSLVNNEYVLVVNDYTDGTSSTKNVYSDAMTATDSSNYETSLATLPSYVTKRREYCDPTQPVTYLEEATRLFIQTRRNGIHGLTQKQLYNAIVQVKVKYERENNVLNIERLLSLGGITSYLKGETRGNVATQYLERKSSSILFDSHVFAVLHFSPTLKTQTFDLVNRPMKREYTGPKRLRVFHISLVDRYGNLIPLSNSWTLKFIAYGYPEDVYASTLKSTTNPLTYSTTSNDYLQFQENKDITPLLPSSTVTKTAMAASATPTSVSLTGQPSSSSAFTSLLEGARQFWPMSSRPAKRPLSPSSSPTSSSEEGDEEEDEEEE
jgi:hypothetical protein